MPTLSIQVNRGLVTSRDPTLLEEGELSQAADCEYRPNNPALWKVSGRTEINSTPESETIKGLTYCEFDAAADKIVVHVGTTYRTSSAVTSGASFSNLVTGLTGGSTLVTAYLANKFYLFNGVDRGYELSSDGTTMLHGMLENTAAPVDGNNGSGTGYTLSTGSTVTYWVEERVKSGSSILKRNAALSTTVATVTGTGILIKPAITRPAQVNSDATHWALFGTATNSTFPTGAEIAEVVIGTETIEDTRTGTNPSLPTGTIYELLSVTVLTATSNVPRNGVPPISSIAEIYEDSLILNDKNDLSKIWYSWPYTPHKIPLQNFIDFPRSDEVTNIKTLGGVLIVLLRDSVWRIHYLPRPEDATFSRETVKEELEGAHGCVGPYAACTYGYGDGNKLAYVSRYGLMVTNGNQWDILSADLDWDNTFNVSQLSKAVLVNNPAKFRLEMLAPSSNSTVNDVCYFFHYHPSHIKADGPSFRSKVTGPIHRPATCATIMFSEGRKFALQGHSNGSVYLGDSGNTEPVGSLSMTIRTGDLALGGTGGLGKVVRMWCHHQAHPNQDATLLHVSRNEGQDDYTKAQIIDLDRRENSQMDWPGLAESFQLGFENSDTSGSVCLDYFMAEVLQEGDI